MKVRWHVIGLITVIWFDVLFVAGIIMSAHIEAKGIGFNDNPEPYGTYGQ